MHNRGGNLLRSVLKAPKLDLSGGTCDGPTDAPSAKRRPSIWKLMPDSFAAQRAESRPNAATLSAITKVHCFVINLRRILNLILVVDPELPRPRRSEKIAQRSGKIVAPRTLEAAVTTCADKGKASGPSACEPTNILYYIIFLNLLAYHRVLSIYRSRDGPKRGET